jgi:probable rRNA maturation factor
VTLEVVVQYAVDPADLPTVEQLASWATAAGGNLGNAEVVLRIVGEGEGADLNQKYRFKRGPTNVLSFPFETPPQVRRRSLGDVVLCAPVIAREAREQQKPGLAHWAHMVVHGMLHLQGYDHESDAQAQAMEALETQIMKTLGYPDPYR